MSEHRPLKPIELRRDGQRDPTSSIAQSSALILPEWPEGLDAPTNTFRKIPILPKPTDGALCRPENREPGWLNPPGRHIFRQEIP